jgi:hypothetical protein
MRKIAVLTLLSFGIIVFSQIEGYSTGVEQNVMDWQIANVPIHPGQSFSIFNRSAGKYVAYGKRWWGINLKWYDSPKSNFIIIRSSTSIGPIKYGERVALKEKKGGYLCYKKRSSGINLSWSSEPVYEWRIEGFKTGTAVGDVKADPENIISLYNIRANRYVVYGKRRVGINLVWSEIGSRVRDHRKR